MTSTCGLKCRFQLPTDTEPVIGRESLFTVHSVPHNTASVPATATSLFKLHTYHHKTVCLLHAYHRKTGGVCLVIATSDQLNMAYKYDIMSTMQCRFWNLQAQAPQKAATSVRVQGNCRKQLYYARQAILTQLQRKVVWVCCHLHCAALASTETPPDSSSQAHIELQCKDNAQDSTLACKEEDKPGRLLCQGDYHGASKRRHGQKECH